ncbi:MAG TPA: helix-turn-helix transcriptional regulator [Pseudonocardiaceae bacterium]|nr:helix-turn-helix transcriptional regulator [Pseudonocardiaceae bacterium]
MKLRAPEEFPACGSGRLTFGWGSLTPAELRVVALVAEGTSNAIIAKRLCLSRYTVESHLKHIFVKLRLSSRAALAAEAARRARPQYLIPELGDAPASVTTDAVLRNGSSRRCQEEEAHLSIDVFFTAMDLYEHEEAGNTHVAVYVHANGWEIFRWNNNSARTSKGRTYPFGAVGPLMTVDQRTLVEVFAWADRDSDWPGPGKFTDDLGSGYVVVGPGATVGDFQLGPTQTDHGNDGYRIHGFTR